MLVFLFFPVTCRAAVSSHVHLVAAAGLRDGELVVLSVDRLALVAQVHAELVLARRGDLVQVGETWGRGTECMECQECQAGTPSQMNGYN